MAGPPHQELPDPAHCCQGPARRAVGADGVHQQEPASSHHTAAAQAKQQQLGRHRRCLLLHQPGHLQRVPPASLHGTVTSSPADPHSKVERLAPALAAAAAVVAAAIGTAAAAAAVVVAAGVAAGERAAGVAAAAAAPLEREKQFAANQPRLNLNHKEQCSYSVSVIITDLSAAAAAAAAPSIYTQLLHTKSDWNLDSGTRSGALCQKNN
jgi:hypothetical protein